MRAVRGAAVESEERRTSCAARLIGEATFRPRFTILQLSLSDALRGAKRATQ